jgi:hypothetical protein
LFFFRGAEMLEYQPFGLTMYKKIRGGRAGVNIRERVLYYKSRVYCLIKDWNHG